MQKFFIITICLFFSNHASNSLRQELAILDQQMQWLGTALQDPRIRRDRKAILAFQLEQARALLKDLNQKTSAMPQ